MEGNENCVFCKIIGKSEDDIIIKQTDNLIVIKDISPASSYHYLVISRKHIPNATHLTAKDERLIQDMISAAEKVLEENGADMSDCRYGFHWPPFHTIDHLHLHAISPAKNIKWYKKPLFLFSWWFVDIAPLD